MTHTFNDKFKIGEEKHSGRSIYLSAPSWDCDWYWGFGYLGNRDCHYHVDGIKKDHDTHPHDAMLAEFGATLTIKDDADLWVFCELMETFYTLKEMAELYHCGGSHLTKNPLYKVLKNKKAENHINKKLLPSVFTEIEKILTKYRV